MKTERALGGAAKLERGRRLRRPAAGAQDAIANPYAETHRESS